MWQYLNDYCNLGGMNAAPYVIIVYGLLVIVGGVIGYTKAKSQASLISGGISGILLVISGVLMFKGIAAASYFALLISLTLLVVFTQRFSAKRAFMPAGLMLILSLLASVVLISTLAMRFLFPYDY